MESNEKQELLPGMSLNDNKAGMEGLDKEKINKIIMENTVGSRYYKNQQKRDLQMKERINKMKEKFESSSKSEQESALKQANLLVEEIENGRDLSRTIVHVDMDAFYAAVEERDCPELKNQPMAVGSIGMLSTSNYVARKYGVRAAMPGFIAKKLCPELIIVPCNFDKYRKVSSELRSIFGEYDVNYVTASLDEAYLDITEHVNIRQTFDESRRTFEYNPQLQKDKSSEVFGLTAQEATREMRFRIHQKTLLTASAGIGPNTMLAKIGSDMNKPNGQTFISPTRDDVMKFISDLPIRKVNGIGKVSEQMLASLQIVKCRHLYEARGKIVLLFTPTSAFFFIRVALACSSTHLEADSERKSMSTERTFSPLSNPEDFRDTLKELCESLAENIEQESIQGKTVTLKIKTIDFELRTRSRSSPVPIGSYTEIYKIANDLLKQELEHTSNNKLSLRLMGVGLSKLESAGSASKGGIKQFLNNNNKISDDNQQQKLDEDKTEDETQRKQEEECVKVEEEEEEELMSCPICNVTYTASYKYNLNDFNTHVDTCLNRQTIREMLKEDEQAASSSSTQQQAKTLKRETKRGGGGQRGRGAKRRKPTSTSSTIDRFFPKI